MDVLAEQSKSNQNHHVESTIHELLDLENLILYKAFPKCLVKAYDAQAMIEGSVNLRQKILLYLMKAYLFKGKTQSSYRLI
jgi:hypothetical protein